MVAMIFCDGFDKYGPPGSAGIVTTSIAGDWSTSSTWNTAPPLSSLGASIETGSAGSATVTFPTTYGRVAGSMWFNIVNGGGWVRFGNGASFAFCIEMQVAPTPGIMIVTGNTNGAVIASAGSLGPGQVHVLSWNVTIGASAAYSVYLDGALLLSGTGNTGNGLTTVNNFTFGTFLADDVQFDNLVIFNSADAGFNPACLISNMVVETTYPTGDSQKQLTNDGNIVPPAGFPVYGIYSLVSAPSVNATPGANTLWMVRIQPLVNCTINSVAFIPQGASGTCKHTGAIYADSSGTPGALLSSGSEVVGTTAGTPVVSNLVTPQSLTAGTSYWIAFFGDTNVTIRIVDNVTLTGRRLTNTYTSGAPSSAAASTGGQNVFQMWGICTGAATNWESVAFVPPFTLATTYGASQAHGSTAALEDLYTFGALATPNIATIYGMAIKGWVAKSDSGARTVSFNTKSGSAADNTGSSPNQALITTGQWQSSFWEADPNTGTFWTVSGLNAATGGVSVAS